MKAILAGKIYPVCAEPIENGIILVEDGKIAAVGKDLTIPEGAEILHMEHCTVTPGLIDAHTYIALNFEPRGMREHSDSDECCDPITPDVQVLDGFYPDDLAIHTARDAGFTTCYVSTGKKNILGGQGAAFKMKPCNDAAKMILPETVQMNASFGEIPFKFHSGKTGSPQTRMGMYSMLREFLRKCADYAAAEAPAYDRKLEAMKPVMQGKMVLHICTYMAGDMLSLMELLNSYGIRYCFVGAAEGHLIPEELAKQDVSVICGSLLAYPFRNELWKSRYDLPVILKKAGLSTVCFTCDETDEIEFLRTVAGRCTALGMTHAQVLEGLTAAPARLLGAEDRIGAIAPGMDADLAFFNGDPLSNLTLCLGVLIDGAYIPSKEVPVK